jgi:integrase
MGLARSSPVQPQGGRRCAAPTRPLPKVLDDAQAAGFLQAAYDEPDPFRRLCVLLLARTERRIGELCAPDTDPVVQIGDCHWLGVTVAKLRNDRLHPLQPPPRRRHRPAFQHVHPHQLRHTLATQDINRGMRREVVAALLNTEPSR